MPGMDTYPAQTTPNNSDYHLVNDGVSGETKKITRTSYLKGAALPTDTVTTAAIADGAVTNAKLATGAGEAGGAWTTYVATLTGITIGNGTVTALYSKTGRTVFVRFHIDFGTSTNITGDITISNPVTGAANAGTGNITAIGSFIGFNGTTLYPGIIGNGSTTTSTLRYFNASATYAVLLTAPSSTVPFGQDTNGEIGGTFTYEAAA